MKTTMMIRTYRELSRIDDYLDRYEYLKLPGSIGTQTFGFDRYLNQRFYRSREWKNVREYVIARDEARDLAFPGFEIHGRIIIHHMNPIKEGHIIEHDVSIIDPEFLICTTHRTHNAIHYGDKDLLLTLPPERKPQDTILWPRIRVL